MKKRIDARQLMESYVGRTIKTVRGESNTILTIEDDSVIVGTKDSSAGKPVPIEHVRLALQHLLTEGEVSLKSKLGPYTPRKSFLVAILLTLPGVALESDPAPSRAVLIDGDALERFLHAEGDSKPSPAEFKAMLKTARQQARKAGLTKSDITAAVRKVRKRA